MNAPVANLPVVIFQLAQPYKDWHGHRLAGALIITFAVLALSVVCAGAVDHKEVVMNVATDLRPTLSSDSDASMVTGSLGTVDP